MFAEVDITKLLKENRIAVFIAAAVLLLITVFAIVIVPIAHKLSLTYQECRGYEEQAAEARRTVEIGRKIDKEYGGRSLISEQEAAVGIEEFTRYAKSLGINFFSIRPGDIIKEEGMPYKILPIELSFQASDEQFIKYMTSIDELKKAIVTIKSFDITPDSIDRRQLKVTMVIDIYLSLQASDHTGV